MKPEIQQRLKGQLEQVLNAYRELREKSQYKDLGDLSSADHQRVIALARAAIVRAAGRASSYASQAEAILAAPDLSDWGMTPRLAGIVEALLMDLEAGQLDSMEELVHAEVFGDFLEMGVHLLDDGYKDAAAVITGSSLEAHLHQLCLKHSIDILNADGARPKKAETMNAELTKAGAYAKLDQKNVTAWLDLRNKAAHGHYGEYTADQVRLMTDAVRNFIARNPA